MKNLRLDNSIFLMFLASEEYRREHNLSTKVLSKSIGVNMSEAKIQTAKGLCVIAMTKHIMEKYKLSQENSFAKLASLDFYKIFLNTDSGLYLEPDYFLFIACDKEISGDKAGMYSFIQNN